MCWHCSYRQYVAIALVTLLIRVIKIYKLFMHTILMQIMTFNLIKKLIETINLTRFFFLLK